MKREKIIYQNLVAAVPDRIHLRESGGHLQLIAKLEPDPYSQKPISSIDRNHLARLFQAAPGLLIAAENVVYSYNHSPYKLREAMEDLVRQVLAAGGLPPDDVAKIDAAEVEERIRAARTTVPQRDP